MTMTYQAGVSQAVAAIREWQRGATTWRECVRVADLTAAQEAAMKDITRTTPRDVVARLLMAAR